MTYRDAYRMMKIAAAAMQQAAPQAPAPTTAPAAKAPMPTPYAQNANPTITKPEFNAYMQSARAAQSPQERDAFLSEANLLPPTTNQNSAMNDIFNSFRTPAKPRTAEEIGQNVQAIRSMYRK